MRTHGIRFHLCGLCGLRGRHHLRRGPSKGDPLECGSAMAENVDMGSSTTFGVSRLDKNQTPVLDGWNSAVADVDVPIAMQARSAPTEATDSPVVEASLSLNADARHPENAAEPTIGSITSRQANAIRRNARSRRAHRLLAITALTTLFWAPVAWLLNWIG